MNDFNESNADASWTDNSHVGECFGSGQHDVEAWDVDAILDIDIDDPEVEAVALALRNEVADWVAQAPLTLVNDSIANAFHQTAGNLGLRDQAIAWALEVRSNLREGERAAIAGNVESIAALLAVCATDPRPSVRAAISVNRLCVDARVQWALTRDDDPLVVLSFLENAEPGREQIEWLIRHSEWDTVRYQIARRRLATDLLELLVDDSNQRVAALATKRLADRLAKRSAR